MQGWAEHMQNAVQYIESHLTEELEMEDIAAKVYVSSFHFQRIFSALCGFTVGEYIRMRRLTLAGEELTRSDARVIDIAMKYGYDSQDSFSRAFTRFHGISPKAAKELGAGLKAFAPLRIKLTLEGGMMMEYKIVEKAAFTVMGVGRKFNADTSYQEIPKFWDEHYQSGGGEKIMGMFGVCMDGDGKQFEYLIADNYCPCLDVPEGCVTRTFPAGTWAVFPCRGALPDSLQKVNTMIWTEWLPNCREYQLAGNYNIEAYLKGGDRPEDFYGEIWVPVERV
ncbi:MAG: AraC family transcriptional regulator [Oscillospiraceae bacterium]|nr:AraC family transcriptional regulator [Oscillospiraceae bacterium]